MKKIIVIGGFSFSETQKRRLAAIGDVSYLESPNTSNEWLKAVQGTDVICSDGSFLLENLHKLKNIFVTYPYIELGSFSSEELAKSNVYVANTQGSNRDSIVQWTMFMVLSLFRKFPTYLNTRKDMSFEWTESLSEYEALIVGAGSIGSEIGKVCEAFGMKVDYFQRGGELMQKTKGKKLIVNALNCNPSSKNLLNEDFFMNVDRSSYYVSFVRPFTYDLDGLIKSLDAGIVSGAGIDCDPEAPFSVNNDFYQKVLAHDKILATPHIAFSTNQAKKNGAEAVVKNIEAFLAGTPINILNKK